MSEEEIEKEVEDTSEVVVAADAASTSESSEAPKKAETAEDLLKSDLEGRK